MVLMAITVAAAVAAVAVTIVAAVAAIMVAVAKSTHIDY